MYTHVRIERIDNQSIQDGICHRSERISCETGAQAYLAGLTFALAASPCSTPVLASLLAYVASSQVSQFLLW